MLYYMGSEWDVSDSGVTIHIYWLKGEDIWMNEWRVYDRDNYNSNDRERRLKCPEVMVLDPWGRVREQEEVKDLEAEGAEEAVEVSAQVPAGSAFVRNVDAR
jgi:hypothetical protein